MDVGMSIASALYELKSEKEDISVKGLMKSGMNIGRDMIGTMTNTFVSVTPFSPNAIGAVVVLM